MIFAPKTRPKNVDPCTLTQYFAQQRTLRLDDVRHAPSSYARETQGAWQLGSRLIFPQTPLRKLSFQNSSSLRMQQY